MINSLIPQLHSCDHITVVYDGHQGEVDLSGIRAKFHTYYEPVALGFWGHGIRNKYARIIEKTDFVMHADDDDIYTPGTFDNLRKLCKSSVCLYIAKFQKGNIVYPLATYIKEGEIGTPCGIIQYDLNQRGKWLERRGGDGKFYEAIARFAKFKKFLDLLIYVTGEVPI